MLHVDVANKCRFPVYDEEGKDAEEEHDACKKNPEEFSAEAFNDVSPLKMEAVIALIRIRVCAENFNADCRASVLRQLPVHFRGLFGKVYKSPLFVL